METIFALASARGKAGVSVIRLSGPASHAAVASLAGDVPPARRASLRRLVWNGDLIDEALVVVFDAGASFTGEASAEFHVHGSLAVVSTLIDIFGQQPELRPAEPGEFTRRAYMNGRLDLTQVEALADLIDAETEQQRRFAMDLLAGSIGRRVETWRGALLAALAAIEATIDFADEGVPDDLSVALEQIDLVTTELQQEMAGAGAAERVRDGFEVALIGRPNVGKSSLINALIGRDIALTSDIAGTTRDVIEARLDIAGLPVTLLDMAGLRDSDDAVEQLGIRRAYLRAEAADLRLFLVDDTGLPDGMIPRVDDLVLEARIDERITSRLGVSSRTREGLDDLVRRIGFILSDRASLAGIMCRSRHVVACTRAVEALRIAARHLKSGYSEFASSEVRVAVGFLDGLVGRIDTEEVLSMIFSQFCVGK
jgi:tRNA modification GTPase